MLSARPLLPLFLAIGCSFLPAAAQNDVPVPSSCTPQVNQKLSDLLSSKPQNPVDNVMVCGITVSASRTLQNKKQNGSDDKQSARESAPGDQSAGQLVLAAKRRDSSAQGNALGWGGLTRFVALKGRYGFRGAACQ